MTATIQVRLHRDPLEPAVSAADPWWCIASPLVAGAWYAYRDRDAAVELASRLYLRLGAVCPVELSDGLP